MASPLEVHVFVSLIKKAQGADPFKLKLRKTHHKQLVVGLEGQHLLPKIRIPDVVIQNIPRTLRGLTQSKTPLGCQKEKKFGPSCQRTSTL